MRALPSALASYYDVIIRRQGKGSLRVFERSLILAAALSCVLAPAYGVIKPVTHTVLIEGMQFSPKVLQVNRGDTVVWINRDLFAHDASSTGKGFKSTLMAPNARWKFVARHTGIFSYTCTLHPMMTASLVVK